MHEQTENGRAYYLDKRHIRQAFNQAAEHYDDTAVLQNEVGKRMLERLALIRIRPQWVADIGAGTCRLTRQLHRHYPKSNVLALDIAENMLIQDRGRRSFWQRSRQRLHRLCGDAEQLPLQDASMDMIFSNLSLQWCNQLDTVFTEFRRLLKPEGLLLFSTFGPDTLKELRQCWQTINDYNHVNAFIDMHDIGDALLRHGFSDPVMDMENFTLTYSNALQLMRELKAIGAHNVTAGRPRGLTGRRQLNKLLSCYEQFRQPDGLLPASYEVIYGHAWCSALPTQQSKDRETYISLSAIKPHVPG